MSSGPSNGGGLPDNFVGADWILSPGGGESHVAFSPASKKAVAPNTPGSQWCRVSLINSLSLNGRVYYQFKKRADKDQTDNVTVVESSSTSDLQPIQQSGPSAAKKPKLASATAANASSATVKPLQQKKKKPSTPLKLKTAIDVARIGSNQRERSLLANKYVAEADRELDRLLRLVDNIDGVRDQAKKVTFALECAKRQLALPTAAASASAKKPSASSQRRHKAAVKPKDDGNKLSQASHASSAKETSASVPSSSTGAALPTSGAAQHAAATTSAAAAQSSESQTLTPPLPPDVEVLLRALLQNTDALQSALQPTL